MNSPPHRPITVWIALTVLALNTLLLLVALFVPPADESVLNGSEVSDIIIDTVEVAAVLISLVVALVALATRRRWGRWFVAAPLVYLIGSFGWEHLTYGLDPDVLLGASVALGPLIIVILLVSIGEAVNMYFSHAAVPDNSTDSSENREPGW